MFTCLTAGWTDKTDYAQGRALDDYPGDFLSTSGEDDLYGQMHEPNGGLRGETAPPMVYSIRSGDSRIGSFVLHKAEFCAGDVVLGNFDFSEASTRCLQVRTRVGFPLMPWSTLFAHACPSFSQERLTHFEARAKRSGKRHWKIDIFNSELHGAIPHVIIGFLGRVEVLGRTGFLGGLKCSIELTSSVELHSSG